MVQQFSILREQQAFSIQEFCARNSISLHLYHKLRQQNRGPRTMALGRAIRISIEAERAWRADREQPTESEARLVKREAEVRSALAKQASQKSLASPRHVSKRLTSEA
jgi:uncharacterized membrane protein YccC